MHAVIMAAPGDIRVAERENPTIVEATDAIIKVTASCVCGSDLWPYRGAHEVHDASMGHAYVGVVAEIGADVKNTKPGAFVVGSFMASDNTCEICQAGYQSRCVHVVGMGGIGTQAEYARIPWAGGTLVATPGMPDAYLVPLLLVVGDGALGPLGILAASQLGATRIIAMSRHADRQEMARDFGATDIVTGGYGAHSVIEAVGTQESMMQAIRATRPGGHVGYVGVSHDVELSGQELFLSGIHLHGGPAPVRRFLPELIELIWARKINPGRVFDLTLPLADAAEAYRAMDERRAIKVLLTP
ncbi:alcohol dehydrogenase catalytic domain-containing protein [Arthrobacter psychrochitiniphilus]|uniref:IMP dehydrogenase n=1 Tax=Arthrobacter psychrochitiniphilus TaxID=291045 RepID=A0A2V3DT75_9MICC|nr:alcohol dehydrogenase catalytic domain-containing protein [Arthrobacter psychrochitiniphilus]NYG17248.1 threonine dehydrogenase-like Zn-dependent dehydrogenase [Arthrobacter psychrochitiniphilus]PXA65475.1 IMP dehydrogenase [Arthrobacter psychrochitiniphilus]